MDRIRPLAASVILGSVLLAGCGPIGPLSGGRLSGDLADGPVADWTFANEFETVQLETAPDDPHSVNIWCAATDGALYVPSSMILGPEDPTEREWVKNVGSDPEVRLRVDGTIYPLRATRVEDPNEYEVAREALEAKYELDPAERDPDREVWIYRLDPR